MSGGTDLNYEKGFISIPVKAVEAGLTGSKLLVFSVINSFSKHGEWCYASQNYLARVCGATRQTVNQAIKWLTENGYIERRKLIDNNIEKCQYRARPISDASKKHPPVKKVYTPLSKNPTPPVKKSDTYNIIDKKDDKRSTTKVVEGKPSNGDATGLEIIEKGDVVSSKETLPAKDNRNNLVEEALDIWEEVMGARPALENNKLQRQYAYNIMRKKDRGGDWLRKMLILLRSAKATPYTSAKITNISDFKSLFYGVDILLQWGQSRLDQNTQQKRKRQVLDLDNMD